jgi:hypothetical protein
VAADLHSDRSGPEVCVRRASAVPQMPEPFNLSQPAWALLDMLQEQLEVSMEVLDTSLRPLVPAGLGDSSPTIGQPGTAAETAKSLRSGEIRIDRSTGKPIGIFPLRVSRQIAGVLLVSQRGVHAAEQSSVAQGQIERAGHLARTALEADLSLTTQLTDARYRTRRAHGILRFLAQLGNMEGEQDAMRAVIQAATLWFDADCRIYERQPDGSFQLAATLPGAEQRSAAARIDRGRAEKLVASRRFSSGGDLEDLGLLGRKEEVLILPIGTPADWLMILAGAIDQDVELTFGAIAGVLAGKLHARECARVDAWQQKLASVADETGRAPERVLLKMLEMLAAETASTEARVSLIDEGQERAIAALAETAPRGTAESSQNPPSEGDRHTACVEISPGIGVQIALASGGARRTAALQLSSWLKALRPWLREAVAGLASRGSLFDEAVDVSSFERRIQEEIERARRFNLGLGLVVIGSGSAIRSMEPIVSAVRAELRASDLMGRIRDGHVAVLLVHTEAAGADSVIKRLRSRLGALEDASSVIAVQVGKATFSPEVPSADALIAHALRHVQNFELRN